MSGAYLNDAEVAERFGISREKVQRLCKSGWPHMRVGKSYRFTEAHVKAIEKLSEVSTPAPTTEESWGVKGRGGVA